MIVVNTYTEFDDYVEIEVYPQDSNPLLLLDFANKDDALALVLKFRAYQDICTVLDENNTTNTQNNT